MPGIQYPLINGNRFDFSSVEVVIDSVLFGGVKEVTYSDSLEPGELRGNRAQLIGRTRGKYGAEGSLTLFKSEFQQMIALLGGQGIGYMEASFTVVVAHSEPGSDVVTDTLIGCRIKKAEDQKQEGGEPLTVKCDLHIMRIDRNGVTPLHPKQMLL